MTNQDLISLAKEYLVIGGVLAGAGVLIFMALYIFVWKKRAKSYKKLYLTYTIQEFGNLTCEKTYTIKMKNVSITTDLELSESNENASVYELPTYTAEELLIQGNEFLSYFDATIDEDETKVYDDTVVFQSKDESYHLWMDYKGGAFGL